MSNTNRTQSPTRSVAGSVRGSTQATRNDQDHDEGRDDKINVEYFYGDRTKLKYFLTQLGALFALQPKKYPDARTKVLYAALRLKGNAFAWFEPTLTDFLKNGTTNSDTETQQIFHGFANFESAIKMVFGVANEDRAAERVIYQIRQKGSAAQYYAQFKQVASKLKWEDNALKAAYYAGLKDEVKDKMIDDVPTDYPEMVEKSIEIDNRLYERRLEKGGRGGVIRRWESGYASSRSTGANNYGDPMDLSAMHEKRSSRPKPRGRGGYNGNNTEREKRRRENLCYNCGKPGHTANECTSTAHTLHVITVKKDEKKAGIVGKKADTTMDKGTSSQKVTAQKADTLEVLERKRNNQEEIPHAYLSWTCCYEDACLTHKSEKEGSGYFPQNPEQNHKRWSTPDDRTASDQESEEFLTDNEGDPYLCALKEGIISDVDDMGEEEEEDGGPEFLKNLAKSGEHGAKIAQELLQLRSKRIQAEKTLREVLARLEEINVEPTTQKYSLSMMQEKQLRQEPPTGQSQFVVTQSSKEGLALVTNHWSIELCKDGDCNIDRQHGHVIFNENAPKEYVRTIRYEWCKDMECKEAPKMHTHQRNREVLDLEIPEAVALKIWGTPNPTMEVSKNE